MCSVIYCKKWPTSRYTCSRVTERMSSTEQTSKELEQHDRRLTIREKFYLLTLVCRKIYHKNYRIVKTIDPKMLLT